MARKKGRMVWVPSIIVDEVDTIMDDEDLDTRAEGFRKLAKYSRTGRQAKKQGGFDGTIFDISGPSNRKRRGPSGMRLF